jgi:hypothetical protein
MKQEIFKSPRYFTLFDFLISHGQLLLRSQKSEDHENNIDIVFYDVAYLQVYRGFDGISIRNIGDAPNSLAYPLVKKYLNNDHSFLFELESNQEKYLIAASFFHVYENQLEFGESSIYFENGREKKIFSSIIK